MKLDYGTLLSFSTIKLPIGEIRKPLLGDIAEITFQTFEKYEFYIKVTPQNFLSQYHTDDGKSFWDLLSDEEKEKINMLEILSMNTALANDFAEMFNFFFVGQVSFQNGKFLIQNGEKFGKPGIIDGENYSEITYIIEQICCIEDKSKSNKPLKFKNKKAKELFEKMQNAEKKSVKKVNYNFTIPNLISAVSSMHNSINIINIWDMTIFQLLDQFNRLAGKNIYNIECTRVSVWGDEKNKFDPAAWYKNEFDK